MSVDVTVVVGRFAPLAASGLRQAFRWREPLTSEPRIAYLPGLYVMTPALVVWARQQAVIGIGSMVCGYVQRLPRLWPLPRLISGTATHVDSGDGGTGWRCNIGPRHPVCPTRRLLGVRPLVVRIRGIG
jgi:hypothetical protein